jgi:GNAT superfamily N-acetyltransferase
MANVVIAQSEDIPAWLHLAREVESLFGPMSNNPVFHRALQKNIDRGTAFCIREADGLPGVLLLGGLLFSAKPPIYTIGWLAVTQPYRRQGLGRRLMEYVIGLVEVPAELVVATFGVDNPAGMPARRFYERLDFHAAEPAPDGPEGDTRQIFRRIIR